MTGPRCETCCNHNVNLRLHGSRLRPGSVAGHRAGLLPSVPAQCNFHQGFRVLEPSLAVLTKKTGSKPYTHTGMCASNTAGTAACNLGRDVANHNTTVLRRCQTCSNTECRNDGYNKHDTGTHQAVCVNLHSPRYFNSAPYCRWLVGLVYDLWNAPYPPRPFPRM